MGCNRAICAWASRRPAGRPTFMASLRFGALRQRELIWGGEPLNPEVIEHVERVWGLGLRDVYGQTETALTVSNPPGQSIEPGSMGRPMPGYVVKLLDESGEEAQEGKSRLGSNPGRSGCFKATSR